MLAKPTYKNILRKVFLSLIILSLYFLSRMLQAQTNNRSLAVSLKLISADHYPVKGKFKISVIDCLKNKKFSQGKYYVAISIF